MDVLEEKYTVFPGTEGEVRTVGNFSFKWKKNKKASSTRWIEYNFSARHKNEKWHTCNSYGYKPTLAPNMIFSGPYLTERDPFQTILYDKVKKHIPASNNRAFWGGYDRIEFVPKAEILEDFKATISKDYAAWRKLRKDLREGKLKDQADENGVTIQEQFDKLEKRKHAEMSVETTQLKIRILQHLQKAKSRLETACEALEINTFTASDASEIRHLGKALGGTGIGPDMRRCASLIRKHNEKNRKRK